MATKPTTRSSTKKMSSAVPETKNKKQEDTKRNYKKQESSDEEDDDSDESYHTESESESTESETDSMSDFITSEEEDEDALADKEYKKFLCGLFPSKYMKNKVEEVEDVKHKKTSKKCLPAPKKKNSKVIEESEEEDEEEEDDEFKTVNGKPSNFNISFIIDDVMRAYSGKESLYDEDDYSDEDEGEKNKEDEEEDDDDDDDESVCECNNAEAVYVNKSKKKNEKDKKEDIADDIALKKMKEMFDALSPEEQGSSVMKGFINRFKSAEKSFIKSKEKESKKQKKKNTKKLKSLFREKDIMNDLKFFHEKMSLEEQKTVLEQIELIHKSSCVDKPYRLSLLDADIPVQYKACAYRKISSLRYMEPGGGEYYKMKNWVDTFMQIPFGKYKNLPISLDDGVEKCHEFMENAKNILDQAVYGLNDAKLQIIQMVGQWIVNPSAIGTAIAIKGPMGTGKTTLVKEGISKILGRDFAFIALGGATDSSFLEGHSYTYEGSTWGKIVDLLIKCKSMNPVIYFDELDKISDTPKGEEIAGILTHLTDTTQNNQFHDRYFSDIDFDLSRCLFIFSYNDESKVNRILLDRMYRIQTKGYDQAQKTTIANQYLMPKICEQVKFKQEDITISEDTMHYIITNYTDKEDGVRTLKRCLEIIHTKLNLYRLMKPDTNIFESEMSIKVEFPMQVTNEIVDKLIKKEVDNGAWKQMYN
jgi:ATP-dependent Lon protease